MRAGKEAYGRSSFSQILTRGSLRAFYILLMTFFIFSGNVSGQNFGGASRIITDYDGYWSSGISQLNPTQPDNTHHLLAFTWNGTTYSTGIDDSNLTANSVIYSPQIYQAFPVRNIQSTNGTYIGLGQLYDGIDNGISNPPPFAVPPNLSSFLTRGLQGLDFGSGVANIAAGNIIFDFTGIIDETQIGDGIPDILVTQMADPSANLDAIFMTDANGNLVGNQLTINHQNIPSVGKWSADFYRLSGNDAAFIKGTRDLRLWVADLSAFGITLENYHLVRSMRYRLNGSSDPAFAAFKVGVFDIIAANDDHAETLPNLPVQINVLENDLPLEILQTASLRILSQPSSGTVQINFTTGQITYTPSLGFAGTDSFVYEICGTNELQCDEALVTIDVAAGALSTEFLGFQVKWLQNRETLVSWELGRSLETPISFVEKSLDGHHWRTIYSERGAISGKSHQFEFIDRFPDLSQPSFYRIRLENESGWVAHSEVRRLLPQKSGATALKLFPNPSTSSITMEWSASLPPEFRIYTSMGLDITDNLPVHQENSSSLTLDLTGLAPGLYILRTPEEIRTITKK